QNKILTPIAGMMISQTIAKGGTIYVGVKKGKDATVPDEFNFEVKNPKKRNESVITMKGMEMEK
ncbi:MAG: hypothetical protein Q7K45_04845, partial [Nanoarchaeota archaeon]|nr:hypothetical protein [Nanoarchaeota archaeon]